MPLPLALIAIGLLTTAYGGKKAVDGVSGNRKAKKIDIEAADIYENQVTALKSGRKDTVQILDNLGKLKLEIWSLDLGRFVSLFERLKDVEISGKVEIEDLKEIKHQLPELKNISIKATELVSGGVATLGAGALAGVASYGGTMTFGAASTGTAISALSGTAATNATLAWFGGGSLASGGLGMAGGVYVLGGLVAGPVLAVGGAVFAAHAKKKLAQAQSNLAEAKKAAQEMKNAVSILNGISNVAKSFNSVILKMQFVFNYILDELDLIFEDYADKDQNISYSMLSEEEKKKCHTAVQAAQVVKTLLETPLLTQEGALATGSQKTVELGKKFSEAHE